jgi:hypothetical protein
MYASISLTPPACIIIWLIPANNYVVPLGQLQYIRGILSVYGLDEVAAGVPGVYVHKGEHIKKAIGGAVFFRGQV